jgi:hypothetical protein
MICAHVDIGNGVTAIVCRSRTTKRCKSCGKAAERECDFPLSGAKQGQTCNAPLCARCASRPLPDTDLCPPHARYLGSLADEAQAHIMDEMRLASDARMRPRPEMEVP